MAELTISATHVTSPSMFETQKYYGLTLHYDVELVELDLWLKPNGESEDEYEKLFHFCVQDIDDIYAMKKYCELAIETYERNLK